MAVILLIGAATSNAQMAALKKFDYRLLENKVLYIPEFDENEPMAKKLIKKGKFDKLQVLKDYAETWKKVMAQSSYDATPYEIRKFDAKKLARQKDERAIVLIYTEDKAGNNFVQMWVTGPKRRLIAQALINGLNIYEENDLRLMINILNYSLNETAEVQEEGNKNRKGLKEKYLENLSVFYNNMDEMTFLIPYSNHKNEKKAAERDAEVKEALQYWTLSPYQFTKEEELQKRRKEGDQTSFYWKNFNYYTANPLITYRFNYIITTDKDEPIFYFLGSKKFKAKTLEEIQEKIKKRAEKYLARQ